MILGFLFWFNDPEGRGGTALRWGAPAGRQLNKTSIQIGIIYDKTSRSQEQCLLLEALDGAALHAIPPLFSDEINYITLYAVCHTCTVPEIRIKSAIFLSIATQRRREDLVFSSQNMCIFLVSDENEKRTPPTRKKWLRQNCNFWTTIFIWIQLLKKCKGDKKIVKATKNCCYFNRYGWGSVEGQSAVVKDICYSVKKHFLHDWKADENRSSILNSPAHR